MLLYVQVFVAIYRHDRIACVLLQLKLYMMLEVYRYQIFPFSDIRYSLFKKKPIPIADPLYITSCFSHVLHI